MEEPSQLAKPISCSCQTMRRYSSALHDVDIANTRSDGRLAAAAGLDGNDAVDGPAPAVVPATASLSHGCKWKFQITSSGRGCNQARWSERASTGFRWHL